MRHLFTSAKTRVSSDMEDFLGFSCGVVELGVAACGVTALGRGVELAIGPGVGSTSAWGMYDEVLSASNSTFTKLPVSENKEVWSCKSTVS